MSDALLLYSTFPNRESALAAAKTLVDKRLVACANVIDGATSVYRWQGTVQQEAEAILFAKTTAAATTRAIETIKTLHPYEVPCIVSLPITDGHAPFLAWVADETR